MKTVKSALIGNKQILDKDDNTVILQLTEVIQLHREMVITKLIGSLPTYLNYRFDLCTNTDMLLEIRGKLIELGKSRIDLNWYNDFVYHIFSSEVVHLANEPFYREIDAYLTTCFLNDN